MAIRAVPIRPLPSTGASMTPELLAQIGRALPADGLKPRVRVTPVADISSKTCCAKRGYRQHRCVHDNGDEPRRSCARTDARVVLAERPEPAWLRGHIQRQAGLEAIALNICRPSSAASASCGLRQAVEAGGHRLRPLRRRWRTGRAGVDHDRCRSIAGGASGEVLVARLLAFAAAQGARHRLPAGRLRQCRRRPPLSSVWVSRRCIVTTHICLIDCRHCASA